MRRLVLRSAVALGSALLAVVGVGSVSPSLADSGWKWATSADYGYQAEELLGSGLTVDTVNARFIPPNRDYFSGDAWRFRITTYVCDPRGVDRATCPVDQHFEGPNRTGNPPKDGSTCVTLGLDGTGLQYCKDNGLAWSTTNTKKFTGWTGSKAFKSGTWICSEIQINSKADGSGAWSNNGTSKNVQKGVRACAEVHG